MPWIRSDLAALVALASCATYQPRPLDEPALAASFLARGLDTEPVRQGFADHSRAWPATWTFDDLWLAAVCVHPDLAAARERVRAAAFGPARAGQPPNPELSFGPEWSANPDPGVSPWVLPATLTLPIALGDERGARAEIAEREHRLAGATAATELWRARERLHLALLRVQFGRQRQVATDAQVAAAEQIAQLVAARVAAGAATAADADAAEVEWQRARLLAVSTGTAVDRARHDLAAAIGVPIAALAAIAVAETPAPPTATTTANAAAETGPTLDDRLRDVALQARGELQQQLAEYAIAEARLRLEVEKQYPDLRLGPGYQYDQGQRKFVLGFALELPLLHGNGAAIAEAEAARTAAAATFAAVQAGVLGEVAARTADLVAADAEASVADELHATAERAAAGSELRVGAGVDDVLQLWRARATAAETAVARIDAAEHRATAAIELELAVGAPLDAPLERAPEKR